MKIAIVGATGLVGRTMLQILHERGFTNSHEIILYASKKSSGTLISVSNKTYIVRELTLENIDKNISFALFSAGATISNLWAKEFTKNGAFVIDNSSAFRRKKHIPLVVPEINANEITLKTKIIANPNCSTILLSIPLFAIHSQFNIKRVIVSTYQAVSGAGMKAINDFKNNTNNKLPFPIYNNLIPKIDTMLQNGYTFEEDKLSYEINKIIKPSKIKLTATAVRVPIENCHSESVNIEFYKKINLNIIENILKTTKGLKLISDNESTIPMPIIANNKNDIYVGRIRKDYSNKNSINLFLCGDNIRKGAALNAIQIMEYILKTFY